jgi:flavin reductase (DIM6/NTAB) family NADH-FMN oxidoreductase RutF
MKKQIENSAYSSLACPRMSAVLTCGSQRVNAITLSWHTPISRDPPLYGVSILPKRFSFKIVENEKEFALNFLEHKHWEKVHYCGTHTGRKEDKIAKVGFTLENCERIKTKMIAQAYANLECKVVDQIEIGDHTLFVGRIEKCWVDDQFWADGKLKVKPVCQLGSYSYVTTDDKSEVFP